MYLQTSTLLRWTRQIHQICVSVFVFWQLSTRPDSGPSIISTSQDVYNTVLVAMVAEVAGSE